ncbi:hypothetical protein THAOC_25357 [Thalassiosira oceanica]|uniref:DNA 3'-5' helicase n=1 Tax=Thalassiosira oceanica TaxID=159749 RepID=K0S823_THAOC|nr:hypothetical protein THAOC_25357 [Thalassiosira oceanica]|eukprot:EJK54972.1 hypothetical protein THAOC_25357 [Thalassiosira oceanica]
MKSALLHGCLLSHRVFGFEVGQCQYRTTKTSTRLIKRSSLNPLPTSLYYSTNSFEEENALLFPLTAFDRPDEPLERKSTRSDAIVGVHYQESNCNEQRECTDGSRDAWLDDANERRSWRIKGLQEFNEANIPSDSKHREGSEPRIETSSNNSTVDLDLPYNDLSQLQAIQSNAPAILLPSGPGTGKSYVLSLRMAYLLQKHIQRKQNRDLLGYHHLTSIDECAPDSMIVISFTKKDAERLKERALDYLFPPQSAADGWRNETSKQLWAGTMHAFSLAILNKYGTFPGPVKVSPASKMKDRAMNCIRHLLNDNEETRDGRQFSRNFQKLHLKAMNDVGQSRRILLQNVVRCIDIWKEVNVIPFSMGPLPENEERQDESRIRRTAVELALRLGIEKSSAVLALALYPEYQARHNEAGTLDPSDLASVAFQLLVENPTALHFLRAKLRHIIVDEYQDLSVSQHALLRLVVRGVVNEDASLLSESTRKKRKSEKRRRRSLPVLLEPQNTPGMRSKKTRSPFEQAYSVPSLFCAGDSSQSIYGWRGGTPELTINGFRRDYPQGIVAPLNTCYRLPSDILQAAEMLLPMCSGSKEDLWDLAIADTTTSYEISPAAAREVGASALNSTSASTSTNPTRIGNHLLLSRGMRMLDSTVLIHGLWDAREEAKYIASTIRRRSKERQKALSKAFDELDEESPLKRGDIFDHTDVAVMVRSSYQLNLIEEELKNSGIPVRVERGDGNEAQPRENDWLDFERARRVAPVPMRPAALMTMHRSKGEEFDDIYLAGWTEGEFPHPEAVSSNRVHEERRLAYVALTRARQRVVVTHSFMKRTLHYGSDGRRKHVTSSVAPSRFLYELVPSKRKEDGVRSESSEANHWLSTRDNRGTRWDRSPGVKEYIAGQSAPEFFQKSYQEPAGYVPRRRQVRPATPLKEAAAPDADTDRIKTIGEKSVLEVVETGLREMVLERRRGSTKKYAPIFRGLLSSFFDVRRGSALVFASGARSGQTLDASPRALLDAAASDLTRKPLARCTAVQLGHYVAYLLLGGDGGADGPGDERGESTENGDGGALMENGDGGESTDDTLRLVEQGIHEIVALRTAGAGKRYSSLFKGRLDGLFGIRRGRALVIGSPGAAAGGRRVPGARRGAAGGAGGEADQQVLRGPARAVPNLPDPH